jgi:hypothetical protein
MNGEEEVTENQLGSNLRNDGKNEDFEEEEEINGITEQLILAC